MEKSKKSHDYLFTSLDFAPAIRFPMVNIAFHTPIIERDSMLVQPTECSPQRSPKSNR